MNKRIAAVTATTCMLFASVMIPAVSAEGTTDIGAQNQVKAVAYSDALDKLDYKGIRVGGLSGLTWDKTADSYVAQSDNHGSDESRVWFLGKDLHNPSITRDPVTFTDVNGTPYNGNTTDNEGIAVLPNGDFKTICKNAGMKTYALVPFPCGQESGRTPDNQDLRRQWAAEGGA